MKTRTCLSALVASIAGFVFLSFNGLVPPATAQLSALMSGGLTMNETTAANGKTTTATVFFSGNATKRAGSDGQDTIVRFDQGKFINVDNKKKTYSEMTFKELEQALNAAGNALGADPEAKEAMAKMQQMMGGKTAPMSVSKQGPGGTIAGYATEKYVVTGPFEMEIWAAPELKVPPAYYDAIKIQIPANPVLDMRKMYDAFKQIDGWPLKNVTRIKMMGMSINSTMEVTSVQKGAVPAATFEVPAGYKLIKGKF